MKMMLALSALLVSTSSFASLPKFINCESKGLVVMQLTLTPTEAALPIYEVELSYQGQQFDLFNAVLVRNTSSQFMVEAQKEDNKIVSVGLTYSEDKEVEGFYQEAANGGMSPLPAHLFESCAVR